MQIPLDHFEQYIDETILKRGLSYFKNGHVGEAEEITQGEYEAVVEGTEDYTVRLTLRNGAITAHSCDCPYDMGPVCKHIVAVIFHLQREALELDTKTKKKKSVQKPKKKTVAQQVDELLGKISYEELKQFVRDKAASNPPFRNLFIASFAQHNADESKEFYVQQIQSILKKASDRSGFIDWAATKRVGEEVGNLLDAAKKQLDKRNYKSVFHIATAVLEQMVEANSFSDDSNGEIGQCAYDAFDLLRSIANEGASEETRGPILEYCLTSFENRLYSDRDWHIDVLQLASILIKTPEETERIRKLIANARCSDYEREETQTILYNILLKNKGEDAAHAYLEQHITNSNLRKIAIENELAKKNYEKAAVLAQNGVKYDQKDRPGLATKWYDWLLKIALAQNDTEKTIVYARMLFIDNFRNEQDYYKILKQSIAPEKWGAYVEGIIQEIITKKDWRSKSLLANIFINEQWWHRLLELVKKSPELETIEHYEKYLSKDYPNEVVELYTNGIFQYMEHNMGRNHYQNACRYIRKIIKIGAKDKANEIILVLRALYPQRRALLEELGKV
jgi:uncharacterized Zn finger protein